MILLIVRLIVGCASNAVGEMQYDSLDDCHNRNSGPSRGSDQVRRKADGGFSAKDGGLMLTIMTLQRTKDEYSV